MVPILRPCGQPCSGRQRTTCTMAQDGGLQAKEVVYSIYSHGKSNFGRTLFKKDTERWAFIKSELLIAQAASRRLLEKAAGHSRSRLVAMKSSGRVVKSLDAEYNKRCCLTLCCKVEPEKTRTKVHVEESHELVNFRHVSGRWRRSVGTATAGDT